MRFFLFALCLLGCLTGCDRVAEPEESAPASESALKAPSNAATKVPAASCLMPKSLRPLPEALSPDVFILRDAARLDVRTETALVNVWAIWCFPCREELPLLDRFKGEQSTIGVYLVNMGDAASDVDKVFAQIDVQHLTTLFSDEADLHRRFGAQGVPFTLIYRDGALRYLHQGLLTPAFLQSVQNWLKCDSH